MSYTQAERYVLTKVLEYGGGVDWGGRGASAAHRKAAIALVERGLLQGSARNCSLTAKGVRAANAMKRRTVERVAEAFAADRKEFEDGR